jgi:hypothetical protein
VAFLPTEVDQMQTHFVVPLQNYESNRTLNNLLRTLKTFFSAVEEGFDKAQKYEALTRKLDSELAALDLSREDLPRFVMFGKK